ncbi:MAG: hypothetical protein ACPL4C_03615, partial [Brevinematia bacterium]
MNEILLIEVIKFSGHVIFTTIGIIGIIVSLILLFFSKEEKKFLFLVFLLLSFLTGYNLSDLILGILGFAPKEGIVLNEQTKSLIITVSKLQILLLIIGIIIFSFITNTIVKSKVLKILSIVFTIIGTILIYFDIFSKHFFLDELKLYNFTYTAKEGNMYDLFLIYFGLVVLTEFSLLIIFKNKITLEKLIRYKSITYGIFFVIIFGILEITEMLNITKLYPYLPSLLGIGISLLSANIIFFLLEGFFKSLIEVLHKNAVIAQTKVRLENSKTTIGKSIEEIEKSISEIKELTNFFKDLPIIAQQITQTIKDKTSKIKEDFNQILSSFKEIKEESEKTFNHEQEEIIKKNIQTINQNIEKILHINKEIISDIEGQTTIMEKSGKSKQKLLSSINNIEETSQISKSQLLEMENIIESIRIISINCYILSNKTKGDNTFELLSKEILSKVERLENTISDLSKINTLLTYLTSELLNKKQELISKCSSIQPKEKPSEELIYELQTRNTESA